MRLQLSMHVIISIVDGWLLHVDDISPKNTFQLHLHVLLAAKMRWEEERANLLFSSQKNLINFSDVKTNADVYPLKTTETKHESQDGIKLRNAESTAAFSIKRLSSARNGCQR